MNSFTRLKVTGFVRAGVAGHVVLRWLGAGQTGGPSMVSDPFVRPSRPEKGPDTCDSPRYCL